MSLRGKLGFYGTNIMRPYRPIVVISFMVGSSFDSRFNSNHLGT
jgi:hypothetical protein